MTNPICYGQTNQGNWCQEWYDSASRHAAARARVLRKAGYRVTVSSMGDQVTNVGRCRMTLVDVRPGTHEDTTGLPAVTLASGLWGQA